MRWFEEAAMLFQEFEDLELAIICTYVYGVDTGVIFLVDVNIGIDKQQLHYVNISSRTC